MNERQLSLNAPVEIGEPLSPFRVKAELVLKHLEGAVPYSPQVEDSFGSWNEMDKVD